MATRHAGVSATHGDSNVTGGAVGRAVATSCLRSGFTMDDVQALDAAWIVPQGSMVEHEYRTGPFSVRHIALLNCTVRQGDK